MTNFPVRNCTRFKPGNPRFDSLLIEAEREIEAFLVYNGSRRPRCRIDVTHCGRGEYKARAVYTSDQGTSHIATVYSRTIEVRDHA